MENYIGKVFDRITVLEDIGHRTYPGGEKRKLYKCQCSCGKICEITRQYLRDTRRKSKSCGCINAENRSALGLSKRKYHPSVATAKEIWAFRYADGDLTLESFLELSQRNCHYCDSPPISTYNKFAHRKGVKNSEFALTEGDFTYNGLDRIDSSKGHDLDNIVPCCIVCNRAKTDHDIEFFRKWICKVHEHWAKEKTQ